MARIAAGKGRKAGTTAPPKAKAAAPSVLALGRIETALAEIRSELSALGPRREVPGSPRDLDTLAETLRESAASLGTSLADVPRVEDFEPLADHLYGFAEVAPRLIESLESVQKAVGPVEAAAATLGEVADTMMAFHQSWNESLLRLPRAEDYEPLAAPLREFARVSPALAETLGAVVRAVAPLPDVVAKLSEVTRSLTRPKAELPAPGEGLEDALKKAAQALGAARQAIREALQDLPRDPAYARAAGQLRELASVSPSLLEWMAQIPALSLPLGGSIATLEGTAQELEAAEEAALRAVEASSAPRSDAPARKSG